MPPLDSLPSAAIARPSVTMGEQAEQASVLTIDTSTAIPSRLLFSFGVKCRWKSIWQLPPSKPQLHRLPAMPSQLTDEQVYRLGFTLFAILAVFSR